MGASSSKKNTADIAPVYIQYQFYVKYDVKEYNPENTSLNCYAGSGFPGSAVYTWDTASSPFSNDDFEKNFASLLHRIDEIYNYNHDDALKDNIEARDKTDDRVVVEKMYVTAQNMREKDLSSTVAIQKYINSLQNNNNRTNPLALIMSKFNKKVGDSPILYFEIDRKSDLENMVFSFQHFEPFLQEQLSALIRTVIQEQLPQILPKFLYNENNGEITVQTRDLNRQNLKGGFSTVNFVPARLESSEELSLLYLPESPLPPIFVFLLSTPDHVIPYQINRRILHYNLGAIRETILGINQD
jgi:hypothetical protein